jgi:hypothetical protein
MKTIITIIIIILSVGGYIIHQHYSKMQHDCDIMNGKFYSISFNEGTCIIGDTVIHLHFYKG